MRVPQVSERIKEAPAQALRGVFAGIGQLLLITDKLRNKASAGSQGAPSRGPVRPGTGAENGPAAASPAAGPADASPAAGSPAASPAASPADASPAAGSREKVPDKTGNVRLLGSDHSQAGAAVTTADASAAAPLPNYDELSVASLRARLRNLDVTQVRQLAEYEKAHAARAEVIGMFERRIAKLEAGG